jgi:uncharacterized protein YvpB
MKLTKAKSQSGSATFFTLSLLLSVVILISLITIMILIARDYLLPMTVPALQSYYLTPGQNGLVSETSTSESKSTSTPTPFQPLPTATQTLTASPTQEPTPTWTSTPTSTDPPPPPDQILAPESAYINNVNGYAQSLPLDCEARSAVDWAAYFGVAIGEFEFLNQLPKSDDPNQGFVGDPNGYPGQTPPYPYGVHASPVARLLRAWGLPAEEVYGLDIDKLKSEIAAGRPVIAWVIIGTQRGYSLDFSTSAGETVLVAPNEHTVIVIGYDPDGVTILDGSMIYWRDWQIFQDSFGVLGNMAIIARTK